MLNYRKGICKQLSWMTRRASTGRCAELSTFIKSAGGRMLYLLRTPMVLKGAHKHVAGSSLCMVLYTFLP